MNKNKLLITASLIAVYLIFVNAIFNYISKENTKQKNQTQTQTSGTNLIIGVSDKAEAVVYRNRFYGKIIETHTQQDLFSKLYLFYFIPLPLKSNNTSFIQYHILATLLLIFFNIYEGERRFENEIMA